MSELAQWLDKHSGNLIQAASLKLSPDEGLRSTVEESISAFYEALTHSARVESMVPLHAILIDWVEARSAPTEDEPAARLAALATLTRVAWEQICRLAAARDALPVPISSEAHVTDS